MTRVYSDRSTTTKSVTGAGGSFSLAWQQIIEMLLRYCTLNQLNDQAKNEITKHTRLKKCRVRLVSDKKMPQNEMCSKVCASSEVCASSHFQSYFSFFFSCSFLQLLVVFLL